MASMPVTTARTTGGRRLTADARRRQLFEVALSLFAEHGYAATTMDDIAEVAGVTKPLVYQHFESKRALYLELMDVFSRDLVDRIVTATASAEGPRQQVELGFAAYFELAMVSTTEPAFRLLYGRDAPGRPRARGCTPRGWRRPSPRPSTRSSTPDSTRTTASCWPTPWSGWPRVRAATGSTPAGSRSRTPPEAVPERPPTTAPRRPPGLAARLADFAWAGSLAAGPPHLSPSRGTDASQRIYAVTAPAATGRPLGCTAPPACSEETANAVGSAPPATLNGTMPGRGPSSPSDTVWHPNTPHSW